MNAALASAAAAAPVAILLPHREVYQPDGAGAVVSCVRDMAAHSHYRERLVVLGDPAAAPFAAPPLLPEKTAAWYYGSRTARYLEGAARTAAALAPALVEVHNRPTYIMRLRRGLPDSALLLYLHNDPQGMRGFKSLAERRRILAAADGAVCVSGHIRARLLAGLAPGLEHKAHVVLNGVDTAALQPLAAAARRKEIIFVGRWIPEKGGLLFAQAAALARQHLPDWRFVKVGAWGFRNQTSLKSYEQEVAAVMQQLGEQGEVTGYLPRAEALARLQQAAIAVMPSQWDDPCPPSVIVGLAAGCEVVASVHERAARVRPAADGTHPGADAAAVPAGRTGGGRGRAVADRAAVRGAQRARARLGVDAHRLVQGGRGAVAVDAGRQRIRARSRAVVQPSRAVAAFFDFRRGAGSVGAGRSVDAAAVVVGDRGGAVRRGRRLAAICHRHRSVRHPASQRREAVGPL